MIFFNFYKVWVGAAKGGGDEFPIQAHSLAVVGG